MSLSRLALRLAAVEALNPSALADSGPWPTIAGNEVYEERLDLLAQSETQEDLDAALAGLENRPVVVVYTEDHATGPYGSVKYPAEENIVTLCVELSIGAQGTVIFRNAQGALIDVGTVDAPVTDREQAALLDVLEEQVRFLFDSRRLAPSASLFRKVAMEIRSIDSDPMRAADRTLRLSTRTLKFRVKVKTVAWPDPGSALLTGLAALPEPLYSVATGLAPDSSGAKLCATLAASMPGATPLQAGPISIHIAAGVGETPANESEADVRMEFNI